MATQQNPFMQWLSDAASNISAGAKVAGKDVNQAYQNVSGATNNLLNNIIPNSAPVKGAESGLSSLDNILKSQPIVTGMKNSPTLGDAAAFINKTLAGDSSPVKDSDKSVLALLPMLAMGGDKGEDVAPEEAATGTRTAEEINAMKATGVEPKINGGQAAPESSGILDSKGNPIPASGTQYTPPPNANLNPNAEQFDSGQQARTPYTPYPGVADQPTAVTDRTGVHPVTGGNPVQVDLSGEAEKNNYYFSDQQKSQAVMDKYVPGNSAQEVEAALPVKLQEESQRIANAIGQNPQQVSSSDIVKDNAAAMASKGYTPGNNVKADDATKALQKELQSQLTAGKNSIVGPSMSGEDIQAQIEIMDKRLQSVYKKRDNNTALTPADTAALTYRQTLSKQLKKMYPGVSDALDRQSAMIDAIPSTAKAAQAERDTLYKNATTPQAPKPGGVATLMKHLGLAATGLSLAGATAKFGPDLYTALTTSKGNSPSLPQAPDMSSIASQQPVRIPNTSDVFQQGVYPYQVKQAQSKLQADTIAAQNNPYDPTLKLAVANDKTNLDSMTSKMNIDLENWNKQHPQNDQMIDNYLSRDKQAINDVQDALGKGALPDSGTGALMNKLTDDNVLANKNPEYASFRAAINVLESDHILSQGDVDKGFTTNAAKAALANKLKAYYGKIKQVMPNYRTTPDYTSPGASLLQGLTQSAGSGVNTGNSTLNQILTPTPSPQASPTPDSFQQLLNAKPQLGHL